MSKNLFDISLEKAILGVILDGKTEIRKIARLHPQNFVKPEHQKLCKVIRYLNNKKIKIDFQNVLTCLSLKKTEQEKEDIENSLIEIYECRRGNFFNIEENIKKLNDLTVARSLQTIPEYLKEIQENEEIKPEETAQHLIQYIQNILSHSLDTSRSKLDVIKDVLKEYHAPTEPTTTKIYSLDSALEGGLVKGRTYGIGGEYGRGKTVLMGTISQNINNSEIPHLVITLETPPEDIEVRSIAKELGITSTDITDGKRGLHEKFIRNTELLLEHTRNNTYYEHVPNADIEKIITLIKKHVYLHQIQGVMIDYWQIIRVLDKSMTYQERLNHIGNRLCSVCREEGIWSLTMVQTKGLQPRDESLISIQRPLSMFINMIRDPNDQGIYFNVEKNNYGPLGFIGSEGNPAAIFDFQGPYIRDRESDDILLETIEEQKEN